MTTAREAERNGNLDIAASAWGEVRLRFPENAEGFTFGGCVLKRLGQLSEDLSVFGEGLDRFPKNEWLAVEQAWALIDLGDFARELERGPRTAAEQHLDNRKHQTWIDLEYRVAFVGLHSE